jgi:hypothetical protein
MMIDLNGPDIEAVDEVKTLILESINEWKNYKKMMPSRSSAGVTRESSMGVTENLGEELVSSARSLSQLPRQGEPWRGACLLGEAFQKYSVPTAKWRCGIAVFRFCIVVMSQTFWHISCIIRRLVLSRGACMECFMRISGALRVKRASRCLCCFVSLVDSNFCVCREGKEETRPHVQILTAQSVQSESHTRRERRKIVENISVFRIQG